MACVGAFSVVACSIFWLAIKATLGLRVEEEEELEGLDYGEHGNVAYPDFQGITTSGALKAHASL
jgi:Amt family ammonium transporter